VKPAKFFSAIRQIVTAFKKSKDLVLEKPKIIVFSSNSNNFQELISFLGPGEWANFKWFELKKENFLKEDVVAEIEEADLVILYSKEPFAEAGLIAYGSEVIRLLTFRYLILLYGKQSEMLTGIIKTSIKINPCKVIHARSKEECIRSLYLKSLEIIPLEKLPSWLEFEIYDGKREKVAATLLILNLVKFLFLSTTMPPIAILYADDFLTTFAGLIKKLNEGSRFFDYLAFLPLLLAALKKQLFRKAKQNNLAGPSLLAFLAVISLLEWTGED
jgi:hypothetical protein